MELEKFIADIASQFEDTDPSVFTADTQFKTLDEWSSLMALSLIGIIDEEYDIVLKGDDIRQADTINDLFEIVKSRL
ncbi:acyl carrier protein [uncultured Rikenella sp.]|uniref:acyl carrier protein n=1 Tax=uncultured Rikenella sp. TaxID=368003 RepID=UPI00263730F0|nr:acyl carrier protein [uncultured Rikenella sp.]